MDADKQWARARVAEIEQAILDLGPEFHVALTQSNETWHDNAPFDALRDTQALLVAEMQTLKAILQKAAISLPKPRKGRVNIGSVVTVQDGTKEHSYFVAGHWAAQVGEAKEGVLVISCASPLGAALLGAKVGQDLNLTRPAKRLIIKSIA